MTNLSSFKRLAHYKKELIILASIVTVGKILSTIALMFLPSSSLEYVGEGSTQNYFLFNFPRAINISKEAIVQAPKATKISSSLTMDSFMLKAIYAQSDGGGFILLINIKTKKDALVSQGETYEGYLLKRILPKKAIFEKGGKNYELLLKEKEVREVKTIQETTVKVDTPQQQDRVARSEIVKYRKNLNLIQKEIRLAPATENGKIKGFDITFVKTGSVFEKLGVQKGDRLIKANGIVLTSAKDALTLYKQIDKIKVFKMVFIRNGQERELEYEIY